MARAQISAIMIFVIGISLFLFTFLTFLNQYNKLGLKMDFSAAYDFNSGASNFKVYAEGCIREEFTSAKDAYGLDEEKIEQHINENFPSCILSFNDYYPIGSVEIIGDAESHVEGLQKKIFLYISLPTVFKQNDNEIIIEEYYYEFHEINFENLDLDSQNRIREDTQVFSPDLRAVLYLGGGNLLHDSNNQPVSRIVVEIEEKPEADFIVGDFIYELSPEGLRSQDTMVLSINYEDEWVTGEEDKLSIGYLDGTGRWVALPSVVDTVRNAVSATITHFSYYGVLNSACSRNDIYIQLTPEGYQLSCNREQNPIVTALFGGSQNQQYDILSSSQGGNGEGQCRDGDLFNPEYIKLDEKIIVCLNESSDYFLISLGGYSPDDNVITCHTSGQGVQPDVSVSQTDNPYMFGVIVDARPEQSQEEYTNLLCTASQREINPGLIQYPLRLDVEYGCSHEVTNGGCYGDKNYGFEKVHTGTDICINSNTHLFSSTQGEIVDIGENGLYGKYIIISSVLPYINPPLASPQRLCVLYAHMYSAPYDFTDNNGDGKMNPDETGSYRGLVIGEIVEQGQHIGVSGDTGEGLTGPHLHFELRINNCFDRKFAVSPLHPYLIGLLSERFRDILENPINCGDGRIKQSQIIDDVTFAVV